LATTDNRWWRVALWTILVWADAGSFPCTEALGRRVDPMGMRSVRAQIVAATLLLAQCATLSSRTGAYEDILAIGATYPAGKLPITRINRLFGRDPDGAIEVVVGHRETRTEMEVTHESVRLAYPEDHRCHLYFSDGPVQFDEFMECVARSPDAIFGVIVGEVVSGDFTLHTIMGFHIHPRDEQEGYAAVMQRRSFRLVVRRRVARWRTGCSVVDGRSLQAGLDMPDAASPTETGGCRGCVHPFNFNRTRSIESS
jgi:hypothetical protein